MRANIMTIWLNGLVQSSRYSMFQSFYGFFPLFQLKTKIQMLESDNRSWATAQPKPTTYRIVMHVFDGRCILVVSIQLFKCIHRNHASTIGMVGILILEHNCCCFCWWCVFCFHWRKFAYLDSFMEINS